MVLTCTYMYMYIVCRTTHARNFTVHSHPPQVIQVKDPISHHFIPGEQTHMSS